MSESDLSFRSVLFWSLQIQSEAATERPLGNIGLQIDINKFEFYATKTKYFGLIILTNGMNIDFEKV